MGFKKLENGMILYDFDFVPKKLIPLTTKEAGFLAGYAIEGDDGQRAPILLDFQGPRYADYGFAFCSIPNERGGETCISTNVQLVASLASLYFRACKDHAFDPWGTDSLASEGITFPILGLDDAKKVMTEHDIPKDKYDFLRERIGM